MKIGLLVCAYGTPEYFNTVLDPWLEYKNLNSLKIAVVHGQFLEHHLNGYKDNDQETQKLIKEQSSLDFIYLQNDYEDLNRINIFQTESEIRNKGLNYLISQDCDFIWLLDLDEVYSLDEIKRTVSYIENEAFIHWFSIEFKNLVFNEKTYINGFKPPRIFRTNINGLKLNHFYWDNDIEYCVPLSNYRVDYKQLTTLTVPKTICNPLHYTWLNNNISKKKIEYQEKHFANGAGCSFRWGQNGLEWNENFFRKTGQNIPILHTL